MAEAVLGALTMLVGIVMGSVITLAAVRKVKE